MDHIGIFLRDHIHDGLIYRLRRWNIRITKTEIKNLVSSINLS